MWSRIRQRSAMMAVVSARIPSHSSVPSRLVRPSFHNPLHFRGLASKTSKEEGSNSKRKNARRYPKTDTMASPARMTDVQHKHKPHNQSPQTKTRIVFDQFMSTLNDIQLRLERECTLLPLLWEAQAPGDEESAQEDERMKLFEATQRVVELLQEFVDSKTPMALRHSHEISSLLERALWIYAQSCSSSPEHATINYFDEASHILQLMETWNLDLQQKHCDYAMEIAARQGLWKEAAEIFERHIDPDRFGYNPFDISVARPVGLYVVARAAQQQGLNAVEATFDSVLKMSMVSPSDQEKYILAAGTALGLAGEWKAFVQYLQTSVDASDMGQVLIAAVMDACLLCNRPDDALAVFDDFIGRDLATANEWQWRGGQDRLNPRCRSLAIHALSKSDQAGAAKRAYNMIEEARSSGDAVGMDDLTSVFAAFENEGRWEDAIELFFHVLDEPSVLVNEVNQQPQQSTNAKAFHLLEIVMRCCNTAGQFGSALLALRIHLLATKSSSNEVLKYTHKESSRLVVDLMISIQMSPDPEKLLPIAMNSLAGLGMHQESFEIMDLVTSETPTAMSDDAMALADISRHQSLSGRRTVDISPWSACYEDLHFVTGAADLCKRRGLDASVLLAMGKAVHACNMTSQPAVGLQLARWLKLPFSMRFERPSLVAPLEESYILDQVPDRLVAPMMNSYVLLERPERALDLFHVHCGLGQAPSTTTILSSIAAIQAMFASGRHHEAVEFYDKMLDLARSPDLFCVTAKGLLEVDRHAEVFEVYRQALSSDCLSEDLTLMSMLALDTSHVEGTTRVLRNMVSEVSALIGCSSTNWLETRYWQLKRLIRRSSLNFLMWWRDPKSSHLDELEFALAHLDKRSALGLPPEDDALRLIVKQAGHFHPGYVPADKTGVARVPRERQGWIEIVNRSLELAQNSQLVSDTSFIEAATRAYQALECQEEYDNLSRSVASQGMALEHSPLLTEDID